MLSIVIPTNNERDNVSELCERIIRTLHACEFEIIFVDDSSDDTPKVLQNLSRRYPFVRFEHRTGKGGLSSAVVRGFAMARGSSVAVMDGDLQHPPELLLPMYRAILKGADLCLASRFISGGDDGGLNWFRKFVSWSARMLGRISLRSIRPISDPTTGFFMFRTRILEGADISPIGWKILIELLAMCHYRCIVEIPMVFSPRKSGNTKLSAKPTFQFIEQLFFLHGRAVKNDDVIIERLSPEECILLAHD